MKLTAVAPAFAVPGPVASVYRDASRTTEDAEHRLNLAWRSLRGQLAHEGADEATLDALDEHLAADRGVPGVHGQAVFAAEGRVLLDHDLADPPPRDRAAWAALPHARPLARQLAEEVPHVVAHVSRTGADIQATAFGRDVEHRIEAHPHDPHLTKVKGGDWAQLKYHHHAENIWAESADEVAGQVNRIAATIAAQVIAVAGDVRARQLVMERLEPQASEITVELTEGGRAQGTDDQGVRRRVAQLCAEVSARTGLEAVQRWSGAGDAAVSGLSTVTAALARGQVGTLLLWDGAEPPPVWIGDKPEQIGVVPDDVRMLGASESTEVAGADGLLRAVAGTDADIAFVPTGEPPADSVAALLRYVDPHA